MMHHATTVPYVCASYDCVVANSAGDSRSGPDTTCSDIICGEHEYVLNHVCTACAFGKTRPVWQGVSDPRARFPSDRPSVASRNNLGLNSASGANTYCWPSRCDGVPQNMNDYVSGASGARRSCSDHSDCCWGLCASGICAG
jgi:hypothetical protein